MRLITIVLILLVAAPAFGDPPSRPLGSFRSAEKVARDALYADHTTTLYCDWSYTQEGSDVLSRDCA